MKHLIFVAFTLVGLFIVSYSMAADFYRETVTLADNDAGTITIPDGRNLAVQCNGEVHEKVCRGNPCVAAVTDAKLEPSAFIAPVDVQVPANFTKLSLKRSAAADTDGGTVSCKVYEVWNK